MQKEQIKKLNEFIIRKYLNKRYCPKNKKTFSGKLLKSINKAQYELDLILNNL